MRRRLVISTTAIVLVVLAAIALPVGLVVYDAAERQLDTELNQTLERVVDAYLAGVATTGFDGRSLLVVLGNDDGVRVERNGQVVFAKELAASASVRPASRLLGDGTRLTVTTDASAVDEHFRSQLQILLILVLGAIAAAAALAAVQARQLALPLERLAARAGRIGDGDFSRQPYSRTMIPEIDRIGLALDTSASRVETMLANERHFTADATHQLRTGITGIAMRLEMLSMHADPETARDATNALRQTDQLNATIDDLLAAARQRTINERQVFDLAETVLDHVVEWRPKFTASRRTIAMSTTGRPAMVYATKGLVGQVLDIAIDNALRHGAGLTTLIVGDHAVSIVDQGPGVADDRLSTLFDGPVDPAARHGRGLSLARRLAQVDGGRLDVIEARPFRLLLTLVQGDATTGDMASE